MRRILRRLLKRASGVHGLEQEVARLSKEVELHTRSLAQADSNLGVLASELRAGLAEIRQALALVVSGRAAFDLVRLDNVSLFVPSNDNLFDKFIPASCKGMTIERHRELEECQTAPTRAKLEMDVTRLMLLYLDVLFAAGRTVHLLDLGAWVGDFALRLGRFAQLRGEGFFSECYDPSNAGALIPFNAELNRLESCVVHRALGLSLSGGPQIFRQLWGNSDASRLESTTGDVPTLLGDSYLVRTVPLQACLPILTPTGHLIVKFDVEGIDAALVLQNLKGLFEASIIIEFAPSQRQYLEIDAIEFLRTLMRTHTIFDLYYLPRPTRATPVGENSLQDFVEDVRHRPYGYTDLLAVPKSDRSHDELVSKLGALCPIDASYTMA